MTALVALLLASAPVPVTGARDVTVGQNNLGFAGCLLDARGAVECWGGYAAVAGADGRGGGVALHGARPWPEAGAFASLAQGMYGGGRLCGLTPRGEVRCASRNDRGPPQDVGVSGAVEVAVSGDFACARLAGGGVTCWGSPVNCELGPRPEAPSCRAGGTLPPAPLDGVRGAVSLALAQYGGCALDAAGALTCWGVSPFLVGSMVNDAAFVRAHWPEAVPGLPPLAKVALGADSICVETKDARVLCGRRDDYKAPVRLAPVPGGEKLRGLAQIAMGYHAAFFVLADGSAWVWGPGLEPDPIAWSRTPPPRPAWSDPVRRVPGLDDALKVAVTHDHACFLTRGGLVRCMGANSHGELGDGTLTPRRDGPPSTVLRFSAEALPEPKGGLGGCTARLALRRGCLAQGDACQLLPPPGYWGAPWCSGAAPPPDWPRRQLEAQAGKAVPECLCSCSAEYQLQQEAERRRWAHCALLP